MHFSQLIATVVACSASFSFAAPVDVKARDAAAKPQYGDYGDYGGQKSSKEWKKAVLRTYQHTTSPATRHMMELQRNTGTYGDYGAYKRDAAAAPVEKREPEAEAEAKPEADPEAKPQYGDYGDYGDYGAYDIPSYENYEGAPTEYGTYGDYGAYKRDAKPEVAKQ